MKHRRKRLVWIVLISGLLLAALADAVRDLRPAANPRIPVYRNAAELPSPPDGLLIVYNANGGLYAGLGDVLHKAILPESYPCNLCLHAFGAFGPKPEWKAYLASLPYKTVDFHKDDFRKSYAFDGPFPAVFIGRDSAVAVLVEAAEINKAQSLPALIGMIHTHLQAVGKAS